MHEGGFLGSNTKLSSVEKKVPGFEQERPSRLKQFEGRDSMADSEPQSLAEVDLIQRQRLNGRLDGRTRK